MKKKFLIATPMLPPTAGGPATHAKKLSEFFGAKNDQYLIKLFNFESLNKLPTGIRHFFAFIKIFFNSIGTKVVFAFDGFTVALPSVLVGKILNKKVILRIGGDLVHEQFVESNLVSMDTFYEKLKSKEVVLDKKLGFKLKVQKYIYANAYGIIFTTEWQKNIYQKFYVLPKNIWVINNPIEKINQDVYKNIPYEKKSELTFTSITRPVAFKNQTKVKDAINFAKEKFPQIYFESELGSWESCLKRISVSRAYICGSISDISPNQVLESLSLDVPVIMTKNSGFYDLLKDKNIVRFVDPFDVQDIKNAIEEMCDENVWQIYKQHTQMFLEKNLWPETWDSLFVKYERIISEKV